MPTSLNSNDRLILGGLLGILGLLLVDRGSSQEASLPSAGPSVLMAASVGAEKDASARESSSAHGRPSTQEQSPSFQHIAPLLARRCLECHSGTEPSGQLDLTGRQAALTGGASGPALVPGQPKKSLLWQRVADGEMPPEDRPPLTDDEKQSLKTWLTQGAPWPIESINPLANTTELRAGYDWWSLQPLRRPKVPQAQGSGSSLQSSIDAFVLARLEQVGLKPNPPADRRVLIRRLTYDLIGLPPTPQEIDAFLNDDSPDAYEKVVDRLLASPHYGERWARHWMDVVRFGESNGFERDQPRPHAFHYRNWLIEAFNNDLPYDQFIRLQLAGDVLAPEDPQAVIATGFLVAGPHNTVLPASEPMKQTMRQDELEDLVAVLGQTFLGMTVNCARCHDHKFDPISQQEYYQLSAALAGVTHGERSVSYPEDAERVQQLQEQVAALRQRLTQLEAPLRMQILADQRSGKVPPPKPPQPLAAWDFREGLRDRQGQLHATKHGAARQSEQGLVLDGRTGYAATVPLKQGLGEKTLEAWVTLSDLKQRGGAAISIQTLDGNVFDAIVYGEREPRRWMAGSDFFRRTRSFQGPAETNAATGEARQPVHLAIVYQADGTITGYRNGRPYGKGYQATAPVTYQAGKAQLIFGLRHGQPGGNRMLAGTLVRAALYDRALSAAEVAASARVVTDAVSEDQLVARLLPEDRQRRASWKAQLTKLQNELQQARGAERLKVYATVPRQPGPVHLLHRGQVTDPGRVVTPGGLRAIGGLSPDFGLEPTAPEGLRRKKLAAWITDPHNPLTPRVIVNRLWHYHFGASLVPTPNDLGFHGGQPTHPELLDWLATELIGQGWSLKTMHRLIVTSATYRQSSQLRPEAQQRDADNRFLWRISPRRLEAEAVRDAILMVAGQLNRQVGGQGYQDFRSRFFKGSQFYDPIDPIGEANYRRTIYRSWARGGRNPLLDVLDCPDPSTTTPRRAVTTTPLQALSLLNNSFVLRMADYFSDRLKQEAGPRPSDRIRLAYSLAYGRDPTPQELALTSEFVQRHRLADLCRVIFNSNEFLYVD